MPARTSLPAAVAAVDRPWTRTSCDITLTCNEAENRNNGRLEHYMRTHTNTRAPGKRTHVNSSALDQRAATMSTTLLYPRDLI